MKQIKSAALLVRSVAYGESDVIATLLTETDGKVAALVRGGRKSSRRVGGALEPFHTIAVTLDDKGTELCTMKEARLTRVRAGIVQNLEALEAAGTALRWARHLCPPRTPEPAAWATLNELLDALDALPSSGEPRFFLAGTALRLLADVGYALDLERCVSCGKPCPPDRPALVDAALGGLVCSACGGGKRKMSARVREIALALQRRGAGEEPEMTLAQADEILTLAEDAMAAHTGLDR